MVFGKVSRKAKTIADIMASRYDVVDVFINSNTKNYITKAFIYNSLKWPAARPSTKNVINARIAEFTIKLINILNNLELQDHFCNPHEFLQTITQIIVQNKTMELIVVCL